MIGGCQRLQHLDALVSSEKNAIAHENEAMRSLISQISVGAQLSTMNLDFTPIQQDMSPLGSVPVGTRFDPQIGQDRVFVGFEDWLGAGEISSSEASQDPLGVPDAAKRPTRHTPVEGDSWAALDFILALEWPCRDHIKHPSLNPNASVPKACEIGGFHGHALTVTHAIYQSSIPVQTEQSDTSGFAVPPSNGLDPATEDSWELPHSEIDK